MNKHVSFWRLLLVFVITTPVFYFSIYLFVLKGDLSDNQDLNLIFGMVPWFMFWVAIFVYFFVRKLTSKKLGEVNGRNLVLSVVSSLVVAVIILKGIFYLINFLT
jgi:hypothetical protein